MFGLNAISRASSYIFHSTVKTLGHASQADDSIARSTAAATVAAKGIRPESPANPLSRSQKNHLRRKVAYAKWLASAADAPTIAIVPAAAAVPTVAIVPAAVATPRAIVMAPLKMVVVPAKIFSRTIDTSLSIVSGAFSCIGSAGSTVAQSYTLGIQGSCGAIAKSCLGWNDLKKARKALPHQPDQILDDKGLMRVDERTFAKRLGEAAGHVFTATTKAATSMTVGTIYVIGTLNNWSHDEDIDPFSDIADPCLPPTWRPMCSKDSMPEQQTLTFAASEFANGVNALGSYIISTAVSAIPAAARSVQTMATPIIQNPVGSVRTAMLVGGIGGCLYYASNKIIAAAQEDTPALKKSTLSRATDVAMATLGVATACMIPFAMAGSNQTA